MEERTVYVGGNIYGAGNIGDDAVLQGILSRLNAEHDLSYLIGTYDGIDLPFVQDSGVEFVNANDPREVVRSIRASDIVICGGGTLISDELNLGFPLIYNARVISTARILGKPVIMSSIGVNKLQNRESKTIARNVMGLCDDISTRDDGSYDVCKELLPESVPLELVADPAYILKGTETPRTKDIKSMIKEEGRTFGVNVVNEIWEKRHEYKKVIAEVCDHLCERQGYTPVFFCNEVRAGGFFDFEANRETSSYMKSKGLLLEPTYYSPGEMIDLLSVFDFVLSMRMHALIFSALNDVPFVSISRVDKVDNFMKLFSSTSSCSIERPVTQDMIRDIEGILDADPRMDQSIGLIVQEQKDRFLAHDPLGRLLDDARERRPRFNPTSLRYVHFRALL